MVVASKSMFHRESVESLSGRGWQKSDHSGIKKSNMVVYDCLILEECGVSGKERMGITEWFLEKSPLSPFGTSLVIFVVIVFSAATVAFIVGEIDLFILDIPVYTVVFGFSILLWGETYVGEKARQSSAAIAGISEFNIQADVDNYLDGVFNIPVRFIVGVIIAAGFWAMYDLLGFWYTSLLIATLGRIFVIMLGFVVGELLVAAYNLLFGTKELVLKLAGKVDIFQYSHISGLHMMATTCLLSASVGGLAGFFALFGMIFAPWRSTGEIVLIPIVVILGLLLLCLVIFVIPLNSIHCVLTQAQEKEKSVLSEKFILLRNLVKSQTALDGKINTTSKNIESIRLLSERVDRTSTWPLDVMRAVGYIIPIFGVIVETLLLMLLGRL